MASKASVILLIAANILIPIAILVFASGFFPYKPFLPGLAIEIGESPEAPFDKVVFMVVDALRRYGNIIIHQGHTNASSDFVFSEPSGFRFTQR